MARTPELSGAMQSQTAPARRWRRHRAQRDYYQSFLAAKHIPLKEKLGFWRDLNPTRSTAVDKRLHLASQEQERATLYGKCRPSDGAMSQEGYAASGPALKHPVAVRYAQHA